MPEWTGILLGTIALLLGGVLKGATGAGAPILAVPILTSFYGVPVAVTLFSLPNILANVFQAWRTWDHKAPPRLTWPFALSGLIGTGVGTLILVRVSPDLLLLGVALMVFVYIAFRLARPNWSLPMAAAQRMSGPLGFAGGFLFGAVGISAPISVTFLNAVRMERSAFVATISIFFAALGVSQVPLLIANGLLTPGMALLSAAALVPMLAGMPIGAYLARFLSPRVFDRLILAFLAIVAARLVVRAIA